MSKPLIYLIAVFSLWLYFRYGNFDKEPAAEKKEITIESADKAFSGFGGARA